MRQTPNLPNGEIDPTWFDQLFYDPVRTRRYQWLLIAALVFIGIGVVGLIFITAFDSDDRPVLPQHGLFVEVCDPGTFVPGVVLDVVAPEDVIWDTPHSESIGCDRPSQHPTGEPIPLDKLDVAVSGQVCNISADSEHGVAQPIAYRVTVTWDAVTPGEPDFVILDTDIVYPAGCIRPYVNHVWPIPDGVRDLVGSYDYRIVGHAVPTDQERWLEYKWTSVATFTISPSEGVGDDG